MRSKFKWIFALLLAFSMQFSFAQEKTITGVVSDVTGPLPGVNVAVKGTSRNAITDFDGKYSISAKAGETLEFSFLSMTTKSIVVGASSSVNVVLEETTNQLGTVVVDGYRTTSKRKSNNAVTTVTAEAVEGRPNVSFLQSLQGQVAGLNIATSSGTPGSSKIDVILRGLSSVNGNTEPLFVIDGIPSNQTIFRGLNNEDIESLTVLKDAGATAIYGNRGANGVIVIKTKGGKYNSKLTVRYTGTTGFTRLQDNNYDLPNSQQTLTLERLVGTGLGQGMSDADIASYKTTDWEDYFFRTGISKNHNISFSQGSDNLTNFTSLSYFDQEGIVPTTDFKRFTLRSNFTGKSSNNKFNYSTNFTASYSQRNQLQQETTSGVNANVIQNPLQGVLTALPYIDPAGYVNGQQFYDEFYGNSIYNPYALLDYLSPGKIPNRYNELKILANASGTYRFNDAFSFTSTAGVDYADSKRVFARAPDSFLAIAVRTTNGTEFGGIETQSTDRDFGFNLLNKLNYLKTFDNEKHTLDVSIFTEYIKAHRSFAGYTQDGLDPRTWSLGAGTGYVPFNPAAPTFYRPTVSATKAEAGLFSYFGSADYDYNSKYGVSATIRRDASYKFISDNTWGTFWSVSGRWNVDQEAFMENVGFDVLKLRGSYGTTGNQNIIAAAYGGNPLYLAGNYTRDLNTTGTGYDNINDISVFNMANRKLQWETTSQANIGIDFTFKKRLSGTLDVYRKETKDVFDTDYVSAVYGTYGVAANTQATILNKGIELLLRYDVFLKGDFKLDVFVNGSYNKNEYKDLIYLPGEDKIDNGNVAQQNGHAINTYNVVPYVGVNPANGNLWFLDINGNVTETVTDADRRVSDKSPIPVWQGGFGLNASYKGFFLNSNFTFVADVQRFDFDLLNMSRPSNVGSYPLAPELLNAWTPENPNSGVPSLTASNIDAGFDYSDRFLRDASYIRLKNLVVGYDVPATFLERTAFKNVRIYTQLENYFTWSSWKGFDVEGLNASNQGGYPSPKVISFGVDLQF